jgi:hypothetical protein
MLFFACSIFRWFKMRPYQRDNKFRKHAKFENWNLFFDQKFFLPKLLNMKAGTYLPGRWFGDFRRMLCRNSHVLYPQRRIIFSQLWRNRFVTGNLYNILRTFHRCFDIWLLHCFPCHTIKLVSSVPRSRHQPMFISERWGSIKNPDDSCRNIYFILTFLQRNGRRYQ